MSNKKGRNTQLVVRKAYLKKRRRKRLLGIGASLAMLALLAAGAGKAVSVQEGDQGSFLLSLVHAVTGEGRDLPEPLTLGSGGTDAADLSSLYSPNAVLAEADTGEILGERGSTQRIYPASLTKIMTAILLIESAGDSQQTIILNHEDFDDLYAQDASMAGFLPGDQVTIQDLVYGILLPSGAECCIAGANFAAGSEDAFVELMNEKAQELGMADTHFCNSTGLHEEDHYSTVKDIQVLLDYALKDSLFREAFTSGRYSLMPSSQHPDGFTFTSTMFKYMDSPDVAGGSILGGKTGYTQEAGLCLASLARINEKEYILVTAGAQGSHETQQYNITDAFTVYNRLGQGA